jgi:hypothetical protein
MLSASCTKDKMWYEKRPCMKKRWENSSYKRWEMAKKPWQKEGSNLKKWNGHLKSQILKKDVLLENCDNNHKRRKWLGVAMLRQKK